MIIRAEGSSTVALTFVDNEEAGPRRSPEGNTPFTPNDCNLRRALVLHRRSRAIVKSINELWAKQARDVLERVGSGLPFSPNLYFNFHTAIDLLLPSLIIDTQLNDIAVLQCKRSRFDVGVREPNMIEKGSRRRLGILQEEL